MATTKSTTRATKTTLETQGPDSPGAKAVDKATTEEIVHHEVREKVDEVEASDANQYSPHPIAPAKGVEADLAYKAGETIDPAVAAPAPSDAKVSTVVLTNPHGTHEVPVGSEAHRLLIREGAEPGTLKG